MEYDVTINSAGIVGLATAFQLSEQCLGLKQGRVDDETHKAAHLTSHACGFEYSGFYYKPEDLKAAVPDQLNIVCHG